MSYEFFRDLNMFIPLAAFGWLAWRTRKAWPADWAKPHYVWHYRSLLLIVLGFVLGTFLGAMAHEAAHNTATFVSPLFTGLSVAVMALCHFWPLKRQSWRIAAQAAHAAEALTPSP